MRDLRLNADFDLVIDSRNDLGVVEDRAAFEQALALWVTDYFYNEIGAASEHIAARITLQAERVVRDSDLVDQILSITVTEDAERPNVFEVNLAYRSGDAYSFEVS